MKDPIGDSIVVYALGAFVSLILLTVSSGASLVALAVSVAIAIFLAQSGPAEGGAKKGGCSRNENQK